MMQYVIEGIHTVDGVGRFTALGSRYIRRGSIMGEHAILADFSDAGAAAADVALRNLDIVADVSLYPEATPLTQLPDALHDLAATAEPWRILTTLNPTESVRERQASLNRHMNVIVQSLCRLDLEPDSTQREALRSRIDSYNPITRVDSYYGDLPWRHRDRNHRRPSSRG